MVLTPSTMLALQTQAPDFCLPDSEGREVCLSEQLGGEALVVIFICNHCPYVKHIKQGLIDFYQDYRDKGVRMLAINANDVDNYPDDSPEMMAKEGYPFPYLFDESQTVAKAYHAACTPDLFLFDGQGHLQYRGQFDASRPKNDVAVSGADLRNAVDAVLKGVSINAEQIPSIGCNIKWKPGNEPNYSS